MKLLLDTHALLWFYLDDRKLSDAAKALILDSANVKFVSPASYWEIAIKVSLGKYVLTKPYAEAAGWHCRRPMSAFHPLSWGGTGSASESRRYALDQTESSQVPIS